MPSLNQAKFIEQAIDSILNQSYKNVEIIIADGGSKDETLSILQKKQQQDARIRYFSEQDTGPANAINKALAKIRGSLIGWLNSDDLYTQGAIIRAVNALQQESSPVMVYGQGEHIDARGKILESYPTLTPDDPLKTFSLGCFICQPTVFFKQTVFLLLGGLDETFKASFDFDYWFRVFSSFPDRIYFIDEVQAQSRLHEDCITHKMRRTVALEGMRVVSKHLGSAPEHWLLTYRDELLNQPANAWGSETLRQHIELAVDDCATYMTEDTLAQLKDSITQDIRLGAV
jgi:glycosyltransferase involved in cell wall biosynthesis